MKTFVAQGIEITEQELVWENLPITQEGAEEFARRQWQAQRKATSRRYPWRQSIRSRSGMVV